MVAAEQVDFTAIDCVPCCWLLRYLLFCYYFFSAFAVFLLAVAFGSVLRLDSCELLSGLLDSCWGEFS